MNIEKKKIKFISKKKNFNPKEQYGGVNGVYGVSSNNRKGEKRVLTKISESFDPTTYKKTERIIKRPFRENNVKLIEHLNRIHKSKMFDRGVNTFDSLDQFIFKNNKEYLDKFYGFKKNAKKSPFDIKTNQPLNIFKNLKVIEDGYNNVTNNILTLEQIFKAISNINILVNNY